MSSRSRGAIQPVSVERQRAEEQFSTGLRNAEREAVVQILSESRTRADLLHVLNNAAGFAEHMAQQLHHPRSPAVDCKEGCSWCCYQSVPVTAPEAFAIAESINSAGDQAAVETITVKLKDVNQRTRGLTPRERTKQHLACAFLDEGRCSIYPARPLACSEFTSMDVADCKRAYRVGFKPRGIVHEKARMVAFYAVQQGLTEGLRESLPASDSAPLELTGAVIAALHPKSAEAWLSGGMVFGDAHLILDPSRSLAAELERE